MHPMTHPVRRLPPDATPRASRFETGFAEGNDCRARGHAPSKFVLVAIADEYSHGFRAGYFERTAGATGTMDHGEMRNGKRVVGF